MSLPDSSEATPRRSFLKEAAAVLIGGVVTLVPAAAGLFAWLDPLRRHQGAAGFVKVGTLDALPADSIPRKFAILADHVDAWTRTPQVPVGAVYLRRIADREVVALHSMCPHAGCFVDYRESARDFYCPCHNSTFAQDGSINDPKSPSPRAMDTMDVEVRGNEIWVRFQNFAAGHKEKRAAA